MNPVINYANGSNLFALLAHFAHHPRHETLHPESDSDFSADEFDDWPEEEGHVTGSHVTGSHDLIKSGSDIVTTLCINESYMYIPETPFSMSATPLDLFRNWTHDFCDQTPSFVGKHS